jgi:inositol 1,4,5-triphosphate receptor type 1
MEDLAHRCLKYGDSIFLRVDGKNGFVSALENLSPQVRVEELNDTQFLDQPPELSDCVFQLTQKFTYTQKNGFLAELTRMGLPEDILTEQGAGQDAYTCVKPYMCSAILVCSSHLAL